MTKERKQITARMANMDQLREHIVPLFLDPVPGPETLHDWFQAAGIPRFKANPTAKNGGGTVFYSVPAVEKFFKARTVIA